MTKFRDASGISLTINHKKKKMNSRIKIINLEMNVSLACNLKCEYCSHFGRQMKGVIPLDELSLWYKTWNHRIVPENVRIMGGEPLLHPNLIEIIAMTRNDWPDSSVELITNGLLVPKMSDGFFASILENEIKMTISRHFDGLEFDRLFESRIKILTGHGIKPNISQSDKSWRKYYRLNDQGQAIPFQSDPVKAWQNCFVKKRCTTLLDNKLYRCPQLGCAVYAIQRGYLSSEWESVLNYQPLMPDCSTEELEVFVHQETCSQCSICPEKFEYADIYQKLNIFGLPIIQKVLCGGNHEST